MVPAEIYAAVPGCFFNQGASRWETAPVRLSRGPLQRCAGSAQSEIEL